MSVEGPSGDACIRFILVWYSRRLQELCGGAIVIDGIDIAKIGLKQLRSSMAIIPQASPLPSSALHCLTMAAIA